MSKQSEGNYNEENTAGPGDLGLSVSGLPAAGKKGIMGVSEWRADVGKGWRPILERLDARLTAIPGEYNVYQVKEKFGTLRVYIGASNPDMYDIVRAAEAESATVCEWCGSPGELDRRYFWMLTLCPGCREQRTRDRGTRDREKDKSLPPPEDQEGRLP